MQKDAEVVAEEEQVFLMKQHSQLNKVPAAGAGGVSDILGIIVVLVLLYIYIC